MRYAIIVLALLGVLASPRPAAALDGNELLETCRLGAGGEAACTYYMIGWHDAFLVAERSSKMGVCIPDEVTVGQMMKELLKYLRVNHGTRHRGTVVLTTMAMQKAWPCR
jgi:hypothetical protein